eukprot:1624595-Prorocentrum_lima.AAC.1
MTSSLVGSEMCIRDRLSTTWCASSGTRPDSIAASTSKVYLHSPGGQTRPCLLYTSDAADDM